MTGLARLGRDAEVRFIPGGDAVSNLGLAFNYGRKGADNKQPTQWVEAALWGKRAESLAQYLTKGQLLDVVLADVHIETYTTRDGKEGHKLAARVMELEFAGGSRRNGEATEGQRTSPAAAPAAAPGSFDDMASDIPF
jgi:single-strand DNA-binding protein